MGGRVWGQGIWGQSQWVESLPRLINDGWKSIGGTGYFGSLAYQVTSGLAQPLAEEIIRAELTYEVAHSINLKRGRRAFRVRPSRLCFLPPLSHARDRGRGRGRRRTERH